MTQGAWPGQGAVPGVRRGSACTCPPRPRAPGGAHYGERPEILTHVPGKTLTQPARSPRKQAEEDHGAPALQPPLPAPSGASRPGRAAGWWGAAGRVSPRAVFAARLSLVPGIEFSASFFPVAETSSQTTSSWTSTVGLRGRFAGGGGVGGWRPGEVRGPCEAISGLSGKPLWGFSAGG